MTKSDVLKLRIQGATREELKELTLMLLIDASEKKMLPEINKLRILVHEIQQAELKFSPNCSIQVKERLKDLVDRMYI
jgi:hypothetical protein